MVKLWNNSSPRIVSKLNERQAFCLFMQTLCGIENPKITSIYIISYVLFLFNMIHIEYILHTK